MKDIYIIFSSTPYKMGKFIRAFTGEKFNHASIMFDENMLDAYTFGRRHIDTPFYGGIIKDSVSRYRHKNRNANVTICKIQAEDNEYDNALNTAREMYFNRERYVYNLFSAAISLTKKRWYIEDSFTCVEFCAYILSQVSDKVDQNKFYSVGSLYEIFKEFSIYTGPFNIVGAEDEDFHTKQGIKKSTKGAVSVISQLMKRKKSF
jgi:hypothetical protein